MKKTTLLIMAVILMTVSSACIYKPKTAESPRENETKRVTQATNSAASSGCERPRSMIGGECCVDENENGICDVDDSSGEPMETLPDETKAASPTSTHAPTSAASTSSAGTSTTAASSTTSGPTQSVPVSTTSTTLQAENKTGQCATSADCGEAYYGTCLCKGNIMTKTRYIPMCANATCRYRSKSETVTCKGIGETSEEEENTESDRCVMGYGRCISAAEYAKYFSQGTMTQIGNIGSSGFSGGYKGYSFRNKQTGYRTPESRCYESIYFVLEIKKPSGDVSEAEVSWDAPASVDGIEIHIGGIQKDDTGKDQPILWVE